MKEIYIVKTIMMNGTVIMLQTLDSFISKELAEKTKERLIELNKDSMFPINVTITKSNLYESEDEIPCLNEKEDL